MLGLKSSIATEDEIYLGECTTEKHHHKPRYCRKCRHRLAHLNTTGECFRDCTTKKERRKEPPKDAPPQSAVLVKFPTFTGKYHPEDIPIAPLKGYADKLKIARLHGYESFRGVCVAMSEKLGGKAAAAKVLKVSKDTVYRAFSGKRRGKKCQAKQI